MPSFYHIHNCRWKCIIGDLDQGQAKGLGMYLEEIDYTKNWKEHLQAIFKTSKELKYKLPQCKNKIEVDELFKQLNDLNSNIKDLFEFYSENWVLASLNPIFSKISLDTWYKTPHNTNVSEISKKRQFNEKSNSESKKKSRTLTKNQDFSTNIEDDLDKME
ncbi:716_t:CDS:2, partial [Gigaspora margarita]